MHIRLKRTGSGAGKSGASGCAESQGGKITFERGFASVQIPDDLAATFIEKMKAGAYNFEPLAAGEGDPWAGLVVDKFNTGTKGHKVEPLPPPEPMIAYADATKLGLGPKTLAPLRKMVQNTDGKTRTLLYREDVDALLAARKGKET